MAGVDCSGASTRSGPVGTASGLVHGLHDSRIAPAPSRRNRDACFSHAFSHGFHPEHGQRLAAYLAEALGGPTTYSDSYGDETSVRLHQLLHDYFAWAITTTMSRHHRSADDVPDGLHIQHWSWDGLVSRTDPDAV